MVSLKMKCEVAEDGSICLQLPHNVAPGLHEMILVLDEKPQPAQEKQADQLMKFAGVWRNSGLDPVMYQHQIREEWQ